MAKNRFHHIFDLESCNKEINKTTIEEFIKEVVSKIEMKILYGPVLVEEPPNNPGLSGFAIISFSHISIHTFSDYDEILIDIFSCKEYDRGIILELCKRYFSTPETKIIQKTVEWGRVNKRNS